MLPERAGAPTRPPKKAVALLAPLAVILTLACGDDDAADARALARDAQLLRVALSDDPTVLPLADVEAALEEDRPVLASERLTRAALPAAKRHLDAVRSLRAESTEGRALVKRAREVLGDRIQALERQRDAYARGLVEDLILLEALDEMRRAEQELLSLLDAVDRGVRGLPIESDGRTK